MTGNTVSDSGADRHPCFNAVAGGLYGRIHLPVAPSCNVQCIYCNRSHDCVHESRPGVSSRLLEPGEALFILEEALSRMPFLTVAGIAGPGDPFSDPGRTLRTFELVRQRYPQLQLCVSSNGWNILPFIEELSDLKVGHVTITVNAVDPAVGERIYAWIRDGNVLIRGREAAGRLMELQMRTIPLLKSEGIRVKVNTVVIPGINEIHAMDIARRVASAGADLMNLIGLIPVPGTPLESTSPPTESFLNRLRNFAEAFLPQMRHCARCRSDAVGYLHGKRRCDASRLGPLQEGSGASARQTVDGVSSAIAKPEHVDRGMR